MVGRAFNLPPGGGGAQCSALILVVIVFCCSKIVLVGRHGMLAFSSICSNDVCVAQ